MLSTLLLPYSPATPRLYYYKLLLHPLYPLANLASFTTSTIPLDLSEVKYERG
jgi:hypothetical protein